MESILNRYRNVTVLVIVLGAQLLLLAYQVKSRQEVPAIRGWAVAAYVPVAKVLEAVRANTIGLLDRYSDLLRAQDQNRQLSHELQRLTLENQFLKTELASADRAKALVIFRETSPHRLLAARVVGMVTGGAREVFIDRGSKDGVKKGMAVITPEGIAGKVTAAYPSGAQVLLLTDPTFRAGVISAKNRTRGLVKGQGHGTVLVEYIPNEFPVTVGEWFYTSGDDRIFPKGLPVGQVHVARPGKMFFQEVFVVPSGLKMGLEEVLVVLNGVHQEIPDQGEPSSEFSVLPPPPAEQTAVPADAPVTPAGFDTEADDVLSRYRANRGQPPKTIPPDPVSPPSAPAPAEGQTTAAPPRQ
ncbi:MAG: rod shape-determining protein MreC [Bryobacteraceae bacterium]